MVGYWDVPHHFFDSTHEQRTMMRVLLRTNVKTHLEKTPLSGPYTRGFFNILSQIPGVEFSTSFTTFDRVLWLGAPPTYMGKFDEGCNYWMRGCDVPTMFTVHPAYIFKAKEYPALLQSALEKIGGKFEPERAINYNYDPRDFELWPSLQVPLVCDIETSGPKCDLERFSVARLDDLSNPWIFSHDIQPFDTWNGGISALRSLLGNPSSIVVGQNFTFDSWALWNQFKIETRCKVYDTIHMANILNPDIVKDLEFLGQIYLSTYAWKRTNVGGEFDRIKYNVLDVVHTGEIFLELERRLKLSGSYEYWMKNRPALFPAIQSMIHRGVPLDEAAHKAWCTEAKMKLEALLPSFAGFLTMKNVKKKKRAKELDVEVMEEGKNTRVDKKTGKIYEKGWKHESSKVTQNFNPSSPSQVLQVLKQLNITLPRNHKTKDKESASSLALLKWMYKNPTHPQSELVGNLVKYSKEKKKLSSFSRLKNPVLYSYKIEGTKTGRPSSSIHITGEGINVHTFPRGAFRKCIIPSPGKMLLAADQSSAESVAVGFLSGDERLLAEVTKAEPDVHTLVARHLHPLVTGLEFDSITDKAEKKRIRQAYKSVTHGGSYGLFEKMLQDLLFTSTGEIVTLAKSKLLLESWHTLFPAVRKWHERVRIACVTGVGLKNPFGRHYVPQDRNVMNLNEWLAWEPQSTIPDVTNKVLEVLWNEVPAKWQTQLLHMGHDSVLYEVLPEYLDDLKRLFLEVASSVILEYPRGKISIKWEVKSGTNWGECG